MSFNPFIFFSLFARLSGFFLISPLFSSRHIPIALRAGLTLLTTLLLFFPLKIDASFNPSLALFILNLIKEGCIGYLLGFVFAFLIESARLGAKMIATLGGFSATELVDPNGLFPSSVISRLFVLTVIALMFAFDLHHFFFHVMKESLTLIPVDLAQFNRSTLHALIKGTSLIFEHAFDYVFAPFIALSLLLVFFALFARLFPNVPIFFIASPLQIIVALVVLSMAISSFSAVFQHSFFQIKALIWDLVYSLTE